MSLFVTDAVAATAANGAATQQGSIGSLLMIAGLFLAMYFLLIRPQNKRAKAHRDLVSQLAKGDEVLTSGGVLGKITNLSDDYVTLRIAEGVEAMFQRHAITKTLPKGTLKSIS